MAKEQAPVIPSHLGLILDGNRRWAEEQGVSSLKGHQRGAEVLKEISVEAVNKGVRHVSAFAFSTENWKRSKTEVTYLMRLIIRFVEKYLEDFLKEDIKILFVGAREGIPPRVMRAIDNSVEKTSKGKRGVIALCINYGGQQEIVDATKKILRERIDPVKLSIKDFSKALYTPELPELDLVVRTSGEYRLSGFMLWRAAYAEFMFVDKHWPAFTKQDLDIVLKQYALRQRRFGS